VNTTFLKKDLLYRAAINARGERLMRLRELCNTQAQISTAKLAKALDIIEEKMKDDSVVMRKA